MVFVAGPRQVGKTTLARMLPGARRGYLNWDVAEDRERILRRELPPARLWVFDEIHKYRNWRNYLKGLYDAHGARPGGARILVTGSARLEAYRFGGDSLQGRYHLLRLHPLSAAELGLTTPDDLRGLLTLGGFPEPYFGSSQVEARRWSRDHRTLLIREEVTSLERIQDLGRLELLMLRLPELVGSPLSINAVREDLQVSHKTAAAWLQVFERLYAIFRLPPFGAPTIRAVKKEQKHYHLDWSVVPSEAPRFENLVACHLLKWVHHQQDTQGRDVEPAVLSRHGRAGGRFRDRGSAAAGPVRRVQVDRRPRRQEPALLQGPFPRLRRLADFRNRDEGLRQRRRHPRRPGAHVVEDVDLKKRRSSGATTHRSSNAAEPDHHGKPPAGTH